MRGLGFGVSVLFLLLRFLFSFALGFFVVAVLLVGFGGFIVVFVDGMGQKAYKDLYVRLGGAV